MFINAQHTLFNTLTAEVDIGGSYW